MEQELWAFPPSRNSFKLRATCDVPRSRDELFFLSRVSLSLYFFIALSLSRQTRIMIVILINANEKQGHLVMHVPSCLSVCLAFRFFVSFILHLAAARARNKFHQVVGMSRDWPDWPVARIR